MANLTLYIVQAFTQRGRKLVAETPMSCKTADEAIRKAERMAQTKAGVVAIQQNVDSETDEVEEGAKILFRAGQLPQSLQED